MHATTRPTRLDWSVPYETLSNGRRRFYACVCSVVLLAADFRRTCQTPDFKYSAPESLPQCPSSPPFSSSLPMSPTNISSTASRWCGLSPSKRSLPHRPPPACLVSPCLPTTGTCGTTWAGCCHGLPNLTQDTVGEDEGQHVTPFSLSESQTWTQETPHGVPSTSLAETMKAEICEQGSTTTTTISLDVSSPLGRLITVPLLRLAPRVSLIDTKAVVSTKSEGSIHPRKSLHCSAHGLLIFLFLARARPWLPP